MPPLRAELRKKGRPLPTNGLWIAAAAMEREASLLTLDAHFKTINPLVHHLSLNGPTDFPEEPKS